MRVKVLVSDPYRDRLELETIGDHILMNFLCESI